MSYEFASNAIDLLSIAILIAALAIVWTRSLGWALVMFGTQSLMLAAAGLCAGLATDSPHIVVGSALTVAVKVLATPMLLWLLLQRLSGSHDAQPSVGQRTGLVIAVIIALVFARSLDTAPFQTAIGAQRVLPAAVTVMLIGIQIMVTHRHALSQVIGFLILENGMALAGLTATYGMPLVVEFGIFLDLLLAVFVAFIYTQRMHLIFGSLDTERLRSLRG
jgi:hydrogenase-4 component E